MNITLVDLSVSSVIFLVNQSIIAIIVTNRINPLIMSREAGVWAMEMKGLGRPAYICVSPCCGDFLYIEKWFDKKKCRWSMKRLLTICSSKVDVFVQLQAIASGILYFCMIVNNVNDVSDMPKPGLLVGLSFQHLFAMFGRQYWYRFWLKLILPLLCSHLVWGPGSLNRDQV